MELPEKVKKILAVLNGAGHEAYAVGGCVRDAFLGRVPEDWDITTDAAPQEVKRLFRRTVDTGIAHGTVTVMDGREGFEVTTYRLDGTYSDGRHPDQVTFTPELSEDLKRRDFTINAMACDAGGRVVDLFGGQEDLRNHVIRCVGRADERFTEDALRILRALRFSAQLDFTIEGETWNALLRHAANLARVSKERILTELNKTLLSGHPERIALIEAAGAVPYIAPHFAGVAGNEKAALLPEKKAVRWASACCGMSPEDTRALLKELKSDTETGTQASLLVRELKRKLPDSAAGIRFLLSEIGPERYEELLCLKKAGFGVPETEEQLRYAEETEQRILAAGDCISLRGLALSGRDLMEAGVLPGPALGETLAALFRRVLEDPAMNTREKLTAILAERQSGGTEPCGKT